MHTLNEHQKSKVALFLPLGAILLQVVTLVLYAITGVTEFENKLSGTVIVFSALFILMGIATEIVRNITRSKKVIGVIPLAKYVVYLLGLLVFLFYLGEKINYLTSILVSIDGTKLSPSFVFTASLSFAAWVSALIAAVSYEKTIKKFTEEHNGNE